MYTGLYALTLSADATSWTVSTTGTEPEDIGTITPSGDPARPFDAHGNAYDEEPYIGRFTSVRDAAIAIYDVETALIHMEGAPTTSTPTRRGLYTLTLSADAKSWTVSTPSTEPGDSAGTITPSGDPARPFDAYAIAGNQEPYIGRFTSVRDAAIAIYETNYALA